ncbi:glucan biosynthesis protein [Marinobacter sp.]|uniref:glucan biosynthesis protein n=1 Tax=Marinobacter sp. TaxID=50741 RepID=UPI00356907E5
MDRRTLLKALLATAGSYGLPPLVFAAPEGSGASGEADGTPFSYAWLKGQARNLASRPYKDHEGEIPDVLKNISWDDYQAIRFREDHALWNEAASSFQVQLFHLGLFFLAPVRIHEVKDGRATELAYNPDYFDYEGEQPLGDLPEDLGFAGFRIHYHANFQLDVASFLGASYFRAVGAQLQYGISARGLAIDTGTGKEEEFPRFTAFWLERPAEDQRVMRVWALLDSPSTTGAYAFTIDPGRNLVMDVDVATFEESPAARFQQFHRPGPPGLRPAPAGSEF